VVDSKDVLSEAAERNIGVIAEAIQVTKLQHIALLIAQDDNRHPLEKLAMLTQMAEDLCGVVVPNSACKNGCNYCCSQAVTIFEPEAEILAKYSGREYTKPAHNLRVTDEESLAMVDRHRVEYTGSQCPFIGDKGECTVYAVRPFACRTCFNISDTPEQCDTSQGSKEFPAIDLSKFWAAHSISLMDYPLGDLREWFPDSN
jgi:Fe-S-cluster containining protein